MCTRLPPETDLAVVVKGDEEAGEHVDPDPVIPTDGVN
jgi:hypothetical protein